jgi:hypothetical protein
MQETSTDPATILQFRQDIEAQLRKEIREALEVALREELAATLASRTACAKATSRSAYCEPSRAECAAARNVWTLSAVCTASSPTALTAIPRGLRNLTSLGIVLS